MRITIAALGTRGDVQPMLALATGLQAAGHSVRFVAGANFESWVRAHGFDFAASIDMEALMQSDAGTRWSQGGDNPMMQLRLMKRLVVEHGDAMLAPLLEHTPASDLLVSGFVGEPFIQTLSESTGVPYLNAYLQPYGFTRSAAASLTAITPRRDSLLNLLMNHVAARLVWSVSAETVNRLRQRLALRPHSAGSYLRAVRHTPTLYGFSPHVVPRPADWGPEKVVTGYWFLDEDVGWQPPAALTAFLQAGPPPVYLGFGSMATRDPQATARLMVAAVERAGQRAIIGSGWSGLVDFAPPASVYVLDHAPHAWLFERVEAVVHHGGAGTTAAGLRAGRPTMVVPHMSDQPYWGRRVHELGVGVRPVPRHKLTVEALADGLARLTSDAALQATATALGAQIRAEDGVGAAVRQLDALGYGG